MLSSADSLFAWTVNITIAPHMLHIIPSFEYKRSWWEAWEPGPSQRLDTVKRMQPGPKPRKHNDWHLACYVEMKVSRTYIGCMYSILLSDHGDKKRHCMLLTWRFNTIFFFLYLRITRLIYRVKQLSVWLNSKVILYSKIMGCCHHWCWLSTHQSPQKDLKFPFNFYVTKNWILDNPLISGVTLRSSAIEYIKYLL